jgi:hypothetical protein
MNRDRQFTRERAAPFCTKLYMEVFYNGRSTAVSILPVGAHPESAAAFDWMGA